jgi:hypothetical protein
MDPDPGGPKTCGSGGSGSGFGSGSATLLRGFIHCTGTKGVANYIWKGESSDKISLRNKECSIFSILSITMA